MRTLSSELDNTLLKIVLFESISSSRLKIALKGWGVRWKPQGLQFSPSTPTAQRASEMPGEGAMDPLDGEVPFMVLK